MHLAGRILAGYLKKKKVAPELQLAASNLWQTFGPKAAALALWTARAQPETDEVAQRTEPTKAHAVGRSSARTH